MYQENTSHCHDCDEQQHVHEILGSTACQSTCNDCHSHRIATVSGEAVASGCSHVHEVEFRTDFADGHYHTFCGTSSAAIDVGNGKHVHYVSDCTDTEACHAHPFQLATLIDSPTDFHCCD